MKNSPQHESGEDKVYKVQPHYKHIALCKYVAIFQHDAINDGNKCHDHHGDQEPRPEVQTTFQANYTQGLKSNIVRKKMIIIIV